MPEIPHNYLPQQYDADARLNINHNYLQQQFSDFPEIFKKIEQLVRTGDYTLGRAVEEFENSFRSHTRTDYALGVGSGTDAIFLGLKALGIGPGDEVLVPTFTFYATVGAIVTAGARPVFIDSGPDFNIDASKLEEAITEQTRAIVPVHWSGLICDMEAIAAVAKKHDLFIVEDACHAIQAEYRGTRAGHYSDAAAFSMHPLKNLNVWGDGGVIVTNKKALHDRLALLRNHGLVDRDTCEVFAYNSRLDTLQAIVGNHLIEKLTSITDARIRNANQYDQLLSTVDQIEIPPRYTDRKQVYHIYSVLADDRDELQKYLASKEIDAKVHYPVPMHLQPAAAAYSYQAGDFPVAESHASRTISLPVHEFIQPEQIEFVCAQISEFYS